MRYECIMKVHQMFYECVMYTFMKVQSMLNITRNRYVTFVCVCVCITWNF